MIKREEREEREGRRSMDESDKRVIRTIEQPANFQYMIFCPGCKCGHGLRVGQPSGANWSFNGDMEKPTFAPSLLITGIECPPYDPETGDYKRGPDGELLLGPDGRLLGAKDTRCHSFIREGMIEFLGDCTHELRGQTVPLEPF
jgi:hypothetical protein